MGNLCCTEKEEIFKPSALSNPRQRQEEDEEDEEKETQREMEWVYFREEKIRVAGSMKLKRLSDDSLSEGSLFGSSNFFDEIGATSNNDYSVSAGEVLETNSIKQSNNYGITDAKIDTKSTSPYEIPGITTPITSTKSCDAVNDLPLVLSTRTRRRKGHRHQRSSPAALENFKVATTKVIQLIDEHRAKLTSIPMEFEDDWKCPQFEKSDHTVEFLQAALIENFLFDSLDQSTKDAIVMSMKPVSFRKGAAIYREGDSVDGFYVVEKGQVKFLEGFITASILGEGCSFGDMSLLYDFPRPATAIAVVDCKLWKLDQRTFKSLLASLDKDDGKSVSKTLDRVPFLKDLSPEVKLNLANALTPIKFLAGDRIVIKGDVGTVFYIVKKGEVRLHDIGYGQSTFEDVILGSGDFFGEHALLTGETHVANVTAVTNCTVLAISQDVFEVITGPLERVMSSGSRLNFLRSIPQLANFTLEEIKQLEQRAKVVSLKPGKRVNCNHIYGILSGRIFWADKNGSLFKLIQGDYFGVLPKDGAFQEEEEKYEEKKEEEAYSKKSNKSKAEEPMITSDTITVDEITTCIRITLKDVMSVIGGDFMSRLGDFKPHSDCIEYKNFKLKDLTKHWVLGKGAYGKVWLVSNISRSNRAIVGNGGFSTETSYYALKMVSKRTVLKLKMSRQIIREKNIMASIQHPFLLGLVSSFQDPDYLYFVLPLIQGGDLHGILKQRKNISGSAEGLPLKDARFYSGCVITALAYLHERNIAYRDLKPENVLIDDDGYGVIADLGFSKVVIDKTYTVCGTPEYIAPEIIVSRGHNCAADYWSFGCLLFEMIAGRTPFLIPGERIDQMTLFKRIIEAKYDFPRRAETTFGPGWVLFSPEAMNLIKCLLIPRKSSRLGNLANGVNDILQHEWFQKIDLKKLTNKELASPWVPPKKETFTDDSSSAITKTGLNGSNSSHGSNDEQDEVFSSKLTNSQQAQFKCF